jgi:hypothetical protein
MAAIWMTARAQWRQHWRSFVVVAVLAGLAGGVALSAFTGSRRADTAFARLEEDVKPPNLSVETGQSPDAELVREAATWPGVEFAMHVAFLAVAPAGRGMLPGSDSIALAFPVVAGDEPGGFGIVEGRRYDERRVDELVVNEAMQEALDADIGDRFSLVSLTPEQGEASEDGGDLPSPAGPTQEVTLVGVARTAEDISDAPDPVLIVTPAYYERHGSSIGRAEGVGLRVDEERRSEIEDRLRSVFGDDAEIEPPDELAARIEDGLAVEVNGLRAFALAAAVAGLVALGQALVRQADTMSEQDRSRRALGMTSRQLIASGVTAVLPAAGGAVLLAAAGTVVGGPLAITGLARQAEPDPGPWFDPVVVPGAIVVGLVVLIVAALASGLAAARGPTQERLAPVRPSRGAALLAGLPPPASVGARMALATGRGPAAVPSGTALAGAAVGIAGVVAALVFGARVDHLLATPKLWGANYDTIVTVGDDVSSNERTADHVAGDPAVAAVALFDAVDLPVYAHDRQFVVGAVAMRAHRGTIPPVVLHGRAPVAPDEAALGDEVLDRLGVDVGDTVEVDRGGKRVALRVVGRYLQPREDDANSGMLVAPQGFEGLEGDGGESGVLVRFKPDVDADAALQRLREVGGQVDVTLTARDAPSNVDNLDELGALPWALAAFLALLAAIAAVHALVSTTRRRRHDLAVLRVLGFVAGQVRSTVRWQALTVAAVGLVIGVPAGVIAGRRIWSALAGAVGVVDAWTFPWLIVVLAVPVAASVAVVLAVLPGRAAARMLPGRVLRAE